MAGRSERTLPSPPLDPDVIAEIEQVAFELAEAAGAEISGALTRAIGVRYKTAATPAAPARDPVSEIDRRVEEGIRESVRKRFPTHVVLGEETGRSHAGESDLVWAVDPIDGTTNFIHGFPFFAASIGVLHHGVPIVGAVWCSASHELRPGVYHARIGGELRFENRALRVRRPSEEVSCRLIGDPGTLECEVFDARSTGSAAVECALVAAGIMSSAVFRRPRVWDVAGGIVLLRAGRKSVRVRAGGAWSEFASFVDAESRGAGIDAISEWRRELVLGAPAIVDRLGELGIG